MQRSPPISRFFRIEGIILNIRIVPLDSLYKGIKTLDFKSSTFLFNSENLRRDELYLVDKDEFGKSNLYSLSEFRNLRTDADYEKKYLSGQFGAIPYEK